MNRVLSGALVASVVFSMLFLGCDKGGDAPAEPNKTPAAPAAGAAPTQPGAPAAGTPAKPAAPAKAEATPAKPAPSAATRPTGLATAYDLLANRALMHLQVAGGLYIPCGDKGFLKYTQGTYKTSWHALRTVDGQPAALTKGIQGIVRFPFDPTVCGDGCDLRFDMKPLRDGQRVSIFVNDKEYSAIETPTGFKTYKLKLRTADLKAGENRIRFHFRGSGQYEGTKSAAAFRSVAIVPRGAEAPAAAPAKVAPLALGGKDRRAASAVPYERIQYFLMLPKQAQLLVATGLADGAGAFAVDVTDARTGETKRVLTHTAIADAWEEHTLDLTPWADKVVRLDFVSELKGATKAGWAEPVIATPPVKTARPAKKAKNVIIWLVDTMRWDRLKALNDANIVKTPNMDALAAEGTLVEHFTVQGAHSIPSHASLVTGLYADAHGHHDDKTRLKPSIDFLSELLQKEGIETGLISSNGYVSTKWGFNQGWDHYKNFIREGTPGSAKFLFDEAALWLKDNYKKRFFLYLVTIDMHVAYRWRDRYCKQYDPAPYTGPVKTAISGHFLNKVTSGRVTLNERDKKRLVATYDCNGTYNDAHLGKLLKLLDRYKIREDTLIMVTADHGEEFFEHGGLGHGHSLHDELVRVPFFLNLPGLVPAGKRIEQNAELVDIAPTVMDLMGFDPNGHGFHGHSLAPYIFGEGSFAPIAAFADQHGMARSMAIGSWKYLLKHGDNAKLFDIAADPYEKKDVREQTPLVDRYCRDVLAFWVSFDKNWQKSIWGTPNNHSEAFAKEASL